MKRFLLLLVLLLVFTTPLYVFAIPLNLDYPTFGGFDLNNLQKDKELESLAGWVYSAIVIISGLAAFVMLVWGGITWMSSAGSPTAISDARGRIQSALLGLLLVLASFLILQVINPELTVLNIPGTPKTTAPAGRLNIPEPKAQPTPFLALTFTVNNTSGPVTAKLGDSLNLAWAATNGSPDCKASGANQWAGSKPEVGSEPITLTQENTYSLSLSCTNLNALSDPPVQKVVTVVISSTPVPIGTSPPKVILQAINPTSGIVSSNNFTLRRDGPKEVKFLWAQTGATQCVAKDELPDIGTDGTIIVPLSRKLASKGDHVYTIRCTNNENNLSAEDSVVITMK